MCGIVAGVAERNVVPILIEGLRRLEYRGYDSAGIAVLDSEQNIARVRAKGKIEQLEKEMALSPIQGRCGIAHTRWATHGVPSKENAHPHNSHEAISLVHNGIIENYLEIKKQLEDAGYLFLSQTDTEVVTHLVHFHYQQTQDLFKAITKVVKELVGTYSLAVISSLEPNRVVGVRSGCPLAVGVGIGEFFLASDNYALMPVTHQFIYLEEGDFVDITLNNCDIYDKNLKCVTREIRESVQNGEVMGKGEYRHFMQKEIYEQPAILTDSFEGRLLAGEFITDSFSQSLKDKLNKVENIHIIACGTSYNAGLLAKIWFEKLGIVTSVEVASEYRYRHVAISKNTLFVSISQSGETADTLAALVKAKHQPYLGYLAICNVLESSIVRESDELMLTRAGREIGVASTKALVAQLATLKILELLLLRCKGEKIAPNQISELEGLARQFESLLSLDGQIIDMAKKLSSSKSMLYLARRELYPIALEGALKLKELSYIHAEAYPSGELKHGPLALVDRNLPIIGLLQHDEITEKSISNLQEVSARHGRLFVFHDERVSLSNLDCEMSIALPAMPASIAPILLTLPMQLLAYHVAVARGTDVDQPRNLAKSVTVE